MEYYIEENVMKRANESSDWIVDVGNNGKLIHYSKSKKWAQGIVDDIKNRLKPGESAMMWGTGKGTNNGWHEWLIANTNGILTAYDSTTLNGQWVSGTWTELFKFLTDRRSQYPNEAIIFARKDTPTPTNIVPNIAQNTPAAKERYSTWNDIFTGTWDVGFIGDSHSNFLI
jgi:hypothetical protein